MRRKKEIVAGILACVAIGVVYVMTAVPVYTATTDLLVERRQVRAVQDVGAGVTDATVDAGALIDSQVEVLKSERIALVVVRRLKLVDNTTFWLPDGSIFTTIVQGVKSGIAWTKSLLVTPPPSDPEQQAYARERAAVSRLLSRALVTRVGKTYLVDVAYTSPSPRQAAEIANAYVEAYLSDQLESKYDEVRRANSWLQTRLDELRQQSLASDANVQRFRAENNLIMVGGQLVSDQQLKDLNTQVSAAQNDLGRTEAKLDQIKSIIDKGPGEALVADALDNPLIKDLRTKYLDASKREADLTARVGKDHASVVRLRGEMGEYQRLMFEELNRTAEAYRSDWQVAKARYEGLQRTLQEQIDVAAKANDKLVALRELERESDNYKGLYQAFLQRYQQTVQQQSFPMTDARVIATAAVPLQPSAPNTPLALTLAVVLGSLAGGAVGAFREYRDRAFRTAKQIRDELRLECLGMLPRIDEAGGPGRDARQAGPPTDVISPALLRYVLDAPFSEFTETLRAAALATEAIQPRRTARVLGIVSALPAEGKTMVAKNLATLIAENGRRTLLIDADLRSPSLTRTLLPKADAGLLEVLTESRTLNQVARVERSSGLVVMPSVPRPEIAHSSHLMASPQMDAFLDKAAEEFDYIILDLPPLGPVIDARAVAAKIDGFFLVVKWGRTSRRIVRATLEANEAVESRCVGAILNDVDLGLLRSYEDEFVDRQHYHQYYYRVDAAERAVAKDGRPVRRGAHARGLTPRLRRILRMGRSGSPPRSGQG